MSALIRIKRRLSDDPLNAIVLNCKKKKIEDSSTDDISAVFKFAGTVNDIEEDVLKLVKTPTKAAAEEQYKKHTTDVLAKLRQQSLEASKNNRLKIINSFRSCNSKQIIEGDVLNCTIVDIEADDADVDEGTVQPTVIPNYVYDLYYTNSDDFGDDDLTEFVSAYPLSDGLVYGSERDNGYRQNESESEDSDDSNAENNWRNDYPDEDDIESNSSIHEEDMLKAMNEVSLNGEDNLSSDDYDESFVYEREHNYAKQYQHTFRDVSDDFEDFDDYDESCTP